MADAELAKLRLMMGDLPESAFERLLARVDVLEASADASKKAYRDMRAALRAADAVMKKINLEPNVYFPENWGTAMCMVRDAIKSHCAPATKDRARHQRARKGP